MASPAGPFRSTDQISPAGGGGAKRRGWTGQNAVQRFVPYKCQNKKRMRKATLSLAICLLLLACKKDDSDDQKPWTCVDYSQTLDSSVIADKILGTWHFVKERGGSNGEVLMADKNIQVTFEPNFTFTVVENSSVITQGDWRLKKFFDIPKEWELDVSSPSRYLRGRIVFCDNQLVFSYSALDGNDKLFKRKDK